jgi:plasmid stabilization system protein ParE
VKLAWSALAIGELRRRSVQPGGFEVSRRYLADLPDAAKRLSVEPGRARLLRGKFRIVRVRSHCLIAQVDAERDLGTIARVLHAAMDIERHLP